MTTELRTEPSLERNVERKAEGRRELRWIRLRSDDDPLGPLLSEPFPPREGGDLTHLISSVRLHGVISPLLVRRHGEGLQVVCGYRRLLAAQAAGLTEVPALVGTLEDAEAIRCYLSENTLRKAPAPRDQEQALRSLREILDQGTDSAAAVTEPTVRSEVLGLGQRLRPLAPPTRPFLPAQSESSLVEASPAEGREESVKLQTDQAAWSVIEAIDSLFGRVRQTKSLHRAQVEGLLDEILRLLEGREPHAFSTLSGRGEEHHLALHSLLVTAFCDRAATVVGWEGPLRRSFLLGGLLHDVGMVFVLEPGLSLPGPVYSIARSRLERHVRIGYALIASTRTWEERVALAARDHHERWDGSGYPDARKGTEVGFPARLLGLIDSYASMVSPRPHRDALTPAFAFERLRKTFELGLFDPSLYPLCASILSPLPVPTREGERMGMGRARALTRP